MKKRILGLVILVMLLVVCVQGEAKAGIWPFTSKSKQPEKLDYTVRVLKPVGANTYNLNLFFPVNGFYTDIFYQCNLIDKFTLEEKMQIIKEVFYNLSPDEPVLVFIDKFDGKNGLMFYFKIVNYEGKPAVLVMTNYDPKKKKVLLTEKDLDNAYMNLYHICDDRLVAHSCLYDQKLLDQLKKDQEWNNIADRYLFDERLDNDSQVEGLLTQALDTDVPELRLVTNMTLVEYHLVSANFEGAGQALENGLSIVDNEIHDRKDYWKQLYKMTEEIYEITKELYQSEASKSA